MLMRERLVYEAVGADAGLCPCAAVRQAPSMKRCAASVADDTRARIDAWRTGREGLRGPGGAGERSSGCLLLWDDTAAWGQPPNRTPGAGGRAGAERTASSVTVVPSRQRVRDGALT